MSILSRLFGSNNPKPPQDETQAILGRHLDGDFIVFPMAELKQTKTSVDAIGRKHGVKYPSEYSAHICGRFPGIYVEVKEEYWARPKLYDVGPFWTFLYALHTYTPAKESEPWMQLDNAAELFQKETGHCAAPVLKVVGNADVYCVDKDGQLVQFIHETNELEAVQLTFWQLFEREVTELRTRKDRKKSGA
jgi:hypothetical protein